MFGGPLPESALVAGGVQAAGLGPGRRLQQGGGGRWGGDRPALLQQTAGRAQPGRAEQQPALAATGEQLGQAGPAPFQHLGWLTAPGLAGGDPLELLVAAGSEQLLGLAGVDHHDPGAAQAVQHLQLGVQSLGGGAVGHGNHHAPLWSGLQGIEGPKQ